MKTKLLFLSILAFLSVGGYFLYSYYHPIHAKCPDDYATDEEQATAMEKWTNNFYDAHPGATLKEWGEARHQFWIDNHCTAALQRYDEAKAGKADPATMERIHNGIQDAITAPGTIDMQKLQETIKKVESEEPPRIGKLPTEAEIHNSPYIQHIRLALRGYLNGTNTGVEGAAIATTSETHCGLDQFDRSYYQSKFIIFDASDDDYGGVQADIVFVDKPDTIFWTWVYRLGGDGEYVLRGFCRDGPSEDKKIEFKNYIEEMIKNAVHRY